MAQDLKTTTLGRTGLELTRLGYGCASIKDVSEDVAETMLNLALDAGMNFIDTAVDYDRSEEFIGKFVSHRRSEFYLASKCGCPVPEEPERAHDYTRGNIVAGVEQSLARMGTDYLDLVQLHSSLTEETLLQHGVIETLHDLRSQGKVRFIHYRDVEGTAGTRFTETFHDDGPTDMARMLEIYARAGFEGPIRPDHAPNMGFEDADATHGYGMLGKIFAFGCIIGMMQAQNLACD